jgi:hypothetical protein
MLLEAQLLTVLTSFANYIPGGQSPLAESQSIKSSLQIQTVRSCAEGQDQAIMAHHHRRHRSSASTENELWFSMSSSARQHQEPNRAPERSAYRETTHRLSTGATSSASARTLAAIPSISTTIDTNKPLPPSPTESERKRRKPAYMRSWLGHSSSSSLDPTHLQPQPYQPYHANQQYWATGTNLSLDTHSSYHHGHSRSMPSSPYDYDQPVTSIQPVAPRASSAAANYPDPMEYQPYIPPPEQQSDITYFPCQPYSSSLNTHLDTLPPRARTFPSETSLSIPTMREGVTSRPRPHTWLSPTDSFSDPSQFSLFVQATTGLPDDAEPFISTGPPQLRGSLFARRSENDVIPLRFQNAQTPAPRQVRTDWQNFEPPPFPHRAAPEHTVSCSRSENPQQIEAITHMVAVNRELEMLGIEDDDTLHEELPDYAQSQAEAHARRRAEASERARELEARWRNTRGG